MSRVCKIGSTARLPGLRLLAPTLIMAGVLWGLGSVAQVQAATLELTGPAGITVAIDGRDLGSLPLDGPVTLAVGKYLITAQAQGYLPFMQTINLTGDSARLLMQIRLTPYSRKTATTSNLLAAGLGQFYLGKNTRGWIYLLTEAGGLMTALGAELQRSNHSNEFQLLQERYDTAWLSEELAAFRTAADQAYSDMEDMEKLRNTGLLVAGGAIILSMLDALIFFPSAVDLGPGPVAPVTACLGDELLPGAHASSTIHAGIRLTF